MPVVPEVPTTVEDGGDSMPVRCRFEGGNVVSKSQSLFCSSSWQLPKMEENKEKQRIIIGARRHVHILWL